jgi:hypothetical protein
VQANRKSSISKIDMGNGLLIVWDKTRPNEAQIRSHPTRNGEMSEWVCTITHRITLSPEGYIYGVSSPNPKRVDFFAIEWGTNLHPISISMNDFLEAMEKAKEIITQAP